MSFRLTPAVSERLRAGQSPIAPMVEVILPGQDPLWHLVGAGEVLWGNKRFVGRDLRFGVLTAASNIADGVSDEAPDWQLTFTPPGDVAAALLTQATAQGGEVNGWLGVIDRTTGLIVPDPIQVFAGELDYARLRAGKGTRTIEWRCCSALEPFHDQEIGARLSDAWHKTIWPGETGLANMTGIEKTSYWGVEKLPSGVTTGSGGGAGLSNLLVNLQ